MSPGFSPVRVNQFKVFPRGVEPGDFPGNSEHSKNVTFCIHGFPISPRAVSVSGINLFLVEEVVSVSCWIPLTQLSSVDTLPRFSSREC